MAHYPSLPGHVDLDRLYREAWADDDPWSSALREEERRDWSWLVRHRVIALLAEAGSGKTHELRYWAGEAKGKRYSFLMRVEMLCIGSVEDAHDTADQAVAFQSWLQSNSEGLFLLDAVDEAKLPRSRTAAPLRDALAALRRAIGDELHRVRLVVTCRSSEWHAATEQEPVQEFANAIAVARKRHGLDGDDEPVLAFTFAPLSITAIDRLGRSRGTDEGFLIALRESGALDHAVTPLDVIHYADVYVEQRDRAGPGLPRTRGELARASVKRRLAETGATWSRSSLRPDESLAGARLLCFALVMAQRHDLSYPGGGGGGSGLDAAAILAAADPPWHVDRVRELLSTALFVPAGQGLVRPYRPEVAAMLAAEHIDKLIASGLSVQRVVTDFFPQSYGRQVIGRAYGPMLAWLATMQPTALRQMIEVAPQLLIETGDPRALALEDRVAILERHVERADTLPGGFFFDLGDLRRFAEPALEHDVVRLLSTTPTGEGLLHLIQLARAGRYTTAASLLVQLAGDPFTPTAVRIYAVPALVECGTPDDLSEAANTMLAWGAPLALPGVHAFERQREDDARHRLVRHAYPGAIDADTAVRLLGQIAGKEWSTNAKPLAGALASAPVDDLQELVTGLDRLCFPQGDGSRPQRAPPASRRMPDLLRSLVTLVGRAIRDRRDMHEMLVPIYGRCLRTISYDRGHGYLPRERVEDLYGLTADFRLAILDAYASGAAPGPWYRILEQFLPAGGLQASTAAEDAPELIRRYALADVEGRRVYADVLTTWIRNMTRSDAAVWRRKLLREAKVHRFGRDIETLADARWRPFAKARSRVRRWRKELPWRAENLWIVLRVVARERWSDFIGLIRDFPHLADGRAIRRIAYLLEATDTSDFLVLDSSAARRRRFGSRLVRGAVAHARRHEPTRQAGIYDWADLLAFAGWGYAWKDDPGAFLGMSDGDAERALLIALTSPLTWPGWGSELAATRLDLFRDVVLASVAREASEGRAYDPRITPDVLGRVSELDSPLLASVVSGLVGLASGSWLPGRGAVFALRRIAGSDISALAELRRLARRRMREAVWEGSVGRVAEWLMLWAAGDPAAIDELLVLRQGPLAGEEGRSAMVRGLEPLVSKDDPIGDRLAPLDAAQLYGLASHLIISFPFEEDDHREGVRVRGDSERGEEVRGAVLQLLGRQYSAAGRVALEDFVERYIEPYDAHWASAWLAGHARDAAESEPWLVEEIVSYGSLSARRPQSAKGLLEAVVQGLREIELDLASSEFDRRALFRHASETDIRAFLAHELDRRHRDHYAITQETVTAREKRTDLRCELRDAKGAVTVVEIKLLHGWTWTELSEKLVTQLLQQYLISERVAHGVFLLVDVGRPPKGDPPSGIVGVDGLLEALRGVVREDPRFEGRLVEIMRLRIDVPPVPVRRPRNTAVQADPPPANGTTGGKRGRQSLVDK